MLQINFYSDSDSRDFADAINEYQKIWEEDGEKIVETWENFTGLTFSEKHINAIVYNGISRSHPLSLRDNIPLERKRGVLVHELGHRILFGKRKEKPKDSLENHKHLFLVLYDVLQELYGDDFAKETVEWDNKLNEIYKTAWEWALQFGVEERKQKLREVLDKD